MITPTPINLDRERSIVYDFASFRAIQTATGHSVLADGFPFSKLGDTAVFVACLHAGLLRDDPSLSMEAVSQFVDGLSFAEVGSIMEAMSVAVMASHSPPRKDEPTDPKAPTP